MKTSDVTYYTDQINSFTPCKAVGKQNYIVVIFPNSIKCVARTEAEADNLYHDCNKFS